MMRCRRLNLKYAVFLLAFLLCCPSLTVLGAEETANDLFSIYNEAELDDYNELKAEYLIAKSVLDDAVSDAQRTELYNATMQSATEYLEQAEAELDEQIDEIIQDNIAIKSDVKENIFGNWDDLLIYDARYKVNTSQIEVLLEKKNKYVVLDKQTASYDSIEELINEVEDLSMSYKAASNVAILGDVTNVVYPLSAETWLTSGWGNRLDPITGTSISFHSGIDLHASTGTQVLALFNGTIYATGYTSAGGYYVKIDHGNGIASYYCHLSEIKCTVGQQVNQYDCIALSGNTGTRTTGPHLHLGIYIDNNSVDPEILFNN